eukprot:g4499.t1
MTYKGTETIDDVVGSGLFTVEKSEEAGVVAVRDNAFSSISSKTLLPFQGHVHVAYNIANGKILGLSKVPRLVSVLARGIWNQQELTDSIAEAIAKATESNEVAVCIKATHIFYDKPIETHTTYRVCTGSEDAVDELMALLPARTVGEQSQSVSKVYHPVGKGLKQDSVDKSEMQKPLQILFNSLAIDSENKRAIEEYGNQLFYATMGNTVLKHCPSPTLMTPKVTSTDNGVTGQLTCVLEFQSLCEHHILPFHGKLFAGCTGKKVDLDRLDIESTVSTLLNSRSRRLQVQERLNNQIADELFSLLPGASVVVICDAIHLCMIGRGIRSHGCSTRTLCTRGKRNADLIMFGNEKLDEELRFYCQ